MLGRLAVTALLAWALAWVLRSRLGRWGWLDRPNARSSHLRSTPRGGGVAFVLAAVLLAPVPQPLLLVPLPLAVVGLADDRFDLPAAFRLPVQLLTGAALALAVHWPLPAALLLAIPATAVINAVNFMDGLDGLVATCLLLWLCLAGFFLQQPALLLLAAALLGFLVWNWSPARLFMGDVGSTYLGAVMAGGLLQALALPASLDQHHLLVSAGLLLAALPLLGDAFSCMVRRLLLGQRLWQAHRLHLYQRLQQAGWSHRRVAGLYLGLTTALAAVALLGQRLPALGGLALMALAAAITLALGWWLDRHVALAFAVPRSRSSP